MGCYVVTLVTAIDGGRRVVSHRFSSFMALIECYECGREISSLAPHCIHCGAPIKITKKKKATKRKASPVELTEHHREQIEVAKELDKIAKLAEAITAPPQSPKHEKLEDVPSESDEDTPFTDLLALCGALVFIIGIILGVCAFFDFEFIKKIPFLSAHSPIIVILLLALSIGLIIIAVNLDDWEKQKKTTTKNNAETRSKDLSLVGEETEFPASSGWWGVLILIATLWVIVFFQTGLRQINYFGGVYTLALISAVYMILVKNRRPGWITDKVQWCLGLFLAFSVAIFINGFIEEKIYTGAIVAIIIFIFSKLAKRGNPNWFKF